MKRADSVLVPGRQHQAGGFGVVIGQYHANRFGAATGQAISCEQIRGRYRAGIKQLPLPVMFLREGECLVRYPLICIVLFLLMKISAIIKIWRKNLMTQPVTSLLRFIWETQVSQNEVWTTFEGWVQHGISRKDAKDKAKAMIEGRLAEQAAEWMSEVDLEQVNWDQFVESLCQCFYRKRLRSPLPEIPSDELWMELTNRQNWGALSLHPQYEKAIQETVPIPLYPLEQKLLAHGGIRLIYRYEPDLKLLLKRGEHFEERADLVPGESGQCHFNTARLWSTQRETLTIMTGYALSEDGSWRQHSWLLRLKPDPGESRLIETTMRRIKYFGVILTKAEAERFSHLNT
jgi:hypothetical protein